MPSTVELEVYAERLTDKAMLCIELHDLEEPEPKSFWLPLSQIEILHYDEKKEYYKISIPEWLAEKVGVL